MIALALLLAAQAPLPPDPASYDALVARAVAQARAGDLAAAETLLAQAWAAEPGRPEARVELAGLRFLDKRYAEAVALLKPVVRGGVDAHARDLLAASLHLGGRPDEAVEAWNALRRPVLRNVRFEGLHDTRSALLVPQLAMTEGALLTRDQLRETRLRLLETGAFDRASVRPVPLGTGESDVEVAVVERRGFGDRPSLVAQTASKALQRTAFVRYENLDGTGIAFRTSYRWQSSQPRAELALRWPRPLGVGATLLAEGAWQRADYVLGGSALRLDARGAELGMRGVVGPRTVGEIRWTGRRRTFEGDTGSVPSARPGLVSGLAARLEHRLADAWRHQLDAEASVFGAARAFGSDLRFTAGRVTLRDVVFLSPPERTTIERSVLAGQVVLGRASAGAPLDVLFVPGAASEMDLPVRAYRDRTDGVLGRTPIGRSIALLNLEWRRRVARMGPAQAGLVAFYDAARVGGVAGDGAESRLLHAFGAGLRLGLAGVIVRADYALSVSGRPSRAFTAGLGQVF